MLYVWVFVCVYIYIYIYIYICICVYTLHYYIIWCCGCLEMLSKASKLLGPASMFPDRKLENWPQQKAVATLKDFPKRELDCLMPFRCTTFSRRLIFTPLLLRPIHVARIHTIENPWLRDVGTSLCLRGDFTPSVRTPNSRSFLR